MEVHELRENIFLKSEKQKAQVKETFDQRAKANEFEVEDLTQMRYLLIMEVLR